MRELTMFKNIIFDFDGVILDAVPMKTEAYRRLFEALPSKELELFIEYHLDNGSISRYEKIKYFFENILKKSISEAEVMEYASRYSRLTKDELCQHKYQIEDSVAFIRSHHHEYNMHIASGADEKDLKEICRAQEIENYFISTHGSPQIKREIVRDILERNGYKPEETVLIGDAMNDLNSARDNGIHFFGYNNKALIGKADYLMAFSDV